MQPEAKASERRIVRPSGHDRDSEEPNTQELQVGPQTCDQTTPTQEQVKDKQRHEKEDEPRKAA